MIKHFTTILFLAFVGLGFTANAQTYTEKTIDMKPGFSDQVFYSMKNGEAGRSSIYNWDIAFTTNLRDNGVRANHMNGIEVYAYPNGDISDWATMDTTGWKKFPKYYNSNKHLDSGAFNLAKDPNNMWDFSWGVYNVQTHAVTGDSLYLLAFKDQSQQITSFKKFWLVNQTSANGNLTIRMANLDNTQDTIVEIVNAGAKYNFTYFSFKTMKTVSREPIKTDWDITFTRWMQYLGPFSPIPYFPSTGVHSNYNTLVAKNHTLPANEINPWNEKANAKNEHFLIGVDWKWNDRQTHVTYLEDSLTYIVFKDSAAMEAHPFYFSSYEGSSTGIIKINVGEVNLGINGPETNNLVVFPNPVKEGDDLTFSSKTHSIDNSYIEIVNVNGQLVYTSNYKNKISPNLVSGLYFLKVISADGIATSKLIVQ